tara:strand:- start:507 stop:686 length:180 start_codon:yes stop_codon:yes gene_type:complete
MRRADLLGVFDVNGEYLRNHSEENGGGRARIRTRVTGLEGQHDIQTTPRTHTMRGASPL